MIYESLELVELGRAEDLVEIFQPGTLQEPIESYSAASAPYVEFAE